MDKIELDERFARHLDYSADLQRIIEDLCRGGPIREPKTSARFHYDMAVAYISAAKSEPVAVKATHKHKRTGGEYTLEGYGELQTDQPVGDYCKVAVYRARDGRLWVRPTSEFAARFATLASEPANG